MEVAHGRSQRIEPCEGAYGERVGSRVKEISELVGGYTKIEPNERANRELGRIGKELIDEAYEESSQMESIEVAYGKRLEIKGSRKGAGR